jgi:hypothetical protein
MIKDTIYHGKKAIITDNDEMRKLGIDPEKTDKLIVVRKINGKLVKQVYRNVCTFD